MNKPDRIMVTGGTGFLGRWVVAEARARGLEVVVPVRSTPLTAWDGDAGIMPVAVDLSRDDPALTEALTGCTAVIHAAAHVGDDITAHLSVTLAGTRHLLDAMDGTTARMVLISSLAVYDTDRLSPGDMLTEDSPMLPLTDDAHAAPEATLDQARDAYAGAKRLQEAMLTRQARAMGAWVLRPGAIWGPGRSWHALQGFWASRCHVTIGSDGELPLAHVSHVARTAVQAALTPSDGITDLNVFDDDRPTRARFLKAHRRCHGWPRTNITMPYAAWLALVRLLRPVSHRLPGLFREPILRARMMPLGFPNTRLRSALGGEDIDTFEAMMARTREGTA